MEKLYAAKLQRNIFKMNATLEDKLSFLKALALIDKNAKKNPDAKVFYSDISDDYTINDNHLDNNKIWNYVLEQISVIPGLRAGKSDAVSATSVFAYHQKVTTHKDLSITIKSMEESPNYGYDQRINDYKRYDNNPEILKINNAIKSIKAILYVKKSNLLYDKKQIISMDFNKNPDPITYQEIIKRLNQSFS